MAGAAAPGVADIEVIRLRLPDTGLAACEDEVSGRLRELCAGFAACLAPWEADAHADHEAAGRAARRAARQADQEVLSYPVWMWHWAKLSTFPRAPPGHRTDHYPRHDCLVMAGTAPGTARR